MYTGCFFYNMHLHFWLAHEKMKVSKGRPCKMDKSFFFPPNFPVHKPIFPLYLDLFPWDLHLLKNPAMFIE